MASDKDFEARLDNILKDTPILDTHNDLPYLLRVQLNNEIYDSPFKIDGDLKSHTDVQRMKKGRLGAQFWSVFIECKAKDPLYQDFNMANSAVRDTLEQIDVIKRALDMVPNTFEMCYTTGQLKDAYKRGKIASMIGAEGLHQVDTSIACIRQYYDLGVRYITLTHNCDNPFATAASSVAAGLPDNGLSEFGKHAVLEMNRLGMLVDLSHVSHRTMNDVLDCAKAPVIFSHSSAYALTPHLRNVPDEVLKRIKDLDGVVQVNFCPKFLTRSLGSDVASIEDAVDHIMHIAQVAGWGHVGLGSDFDGIPEGPKGLEDVSKYPDLIKRCMERGATDEQIRGLVGGNLLRVWGECEQAAGRLSAAMGPVEANWPGRDWTFWSSSDQLPRMFVGAEVKGRCVNG